jgi:hypothetical protein
MLVKQQACLPACSAIHAHSPQLVEAELEGWKARQCTKTCESASRPYVGVRGGPPIMSSNSRRKRRIRPRRGRASAAADPHTGVDTTALCITDAKASKTLVVVWFPQYPFDGHNYDAVWNIVRVWQLDGGLELSIPHALGLWLPSCSFDFDVALARLVGTDCVHRDPHRRAPTSMRVSPSSTRRR